MKKTQVALAALALVASTAALAEGVTIYGTIDASMAKSTGVANSLDGTGNWGTSLFGIKGSQDVSGIGSVFFNLESGLNAATGGFANAGVINADGTATAITGTGTLFARAANIGLSTDAGKIAVGTQFSPFVGAALGGDVSGNASFYVPMLIVAGGNTAQMFGAGGDETAGGALSGGFFIPNSVTYTTPNFNGLDATVMMQRSAGVVENKYNAVRVSYAVSALKVNFGYQKRGGTTGALNTEGFNNYTSTAITGTYQVSDAISIGAGFYANNDKEGGIKTRATSLGLGYTISPATIVSLNYVGNDTEGAKATIMNLGLRHNLSKQTYLYGTVGRGTNGASTVYSMRAVDSAAGGTPNYDATLNQTGYAVGIGHNF